MFAKNSLASFEPSKAIPLPTFLKLLTSTGLAMDKAIAAASRIYKTHNTPAALAQLTDGALTALHIGDKEQRRLVLKAVRPGGKSKFQDPVTAAAAAAATLSASSSSSKKKKTSPKKRKRDDDLNELLPEGPPDEAAAFGSLEFDELLDEKVLITKSAVVNRAPVMTAWAMIVAERMGFRREEALSIAQVYTEMTATSKGVRLGIFEEGRGKGMEAAEKGTQPYVDFMDRRIPLFNTRSSQWRALLKGEPVVPSSAYAYITNAFRQTTGHVLGAMRLLAGSYSPRELNRAAFGLYANFRPHVEGWGKKAELRCEAILALRKEGGTGEGAKVAPVVTPSQLGSHETNPKKPRNGLTAEEYEAALDAEGYDDTLFIEPGDDHGG